MLLLCTVKDILFWFLSFITPSCVLECTFSSLAHRILGNTPRNSITHSQMKEAHGRGGTAVHTEQQMITGETPTEHEHKHLVSWDLRVPFSIIVTAFSATGRSVGLSCCCCASPKLEKHLASKYFLFKNISQYFF